MNRRRLFAIPFATFFAAAMGRSAFAEGQVGSARAQTGPEQTIRIDGVDGTKIRLTLEGRESWVVETASLQVRPNGDAVELVAQRGENFIRQPGDSVAETFRLSIRPNGGLAFHLTNVKPK